jgi:hypothetical protein
MAQTMYVHMNKWIKKSEIQFIQLINFN